MKIILTESQLKKVVSRNVETNSKYLNEDGIIKMIKNLVSPEIKLVKNITNFATDFRFASQQTRNIMAKFGVVVNTPKIRQLMVPVNDTLPVIAHELNQVFKGKLNPNFNLGTSFKFDFDNLKKALRVPEGQTLNISLAYRQAENLKDYINRMKSEKMVAPSGLPILKRAEEQVNTILREMETAVSKIAFAK